MAESRVTPPYLRYNNISDLSQIKIKKDSAISQLPKQSGTLSDVKPVKIDISTSDIKSMSDINPVFEDSISPIAIKNLAKSNLRKTKSSLSEDSSANSLKAAANLTSPSGKVHIGWHCSTGFRARVFQPDTAVYEWILEVGQNKYSLLIETSKQNSEIFFDVDGKTYGSAFNSLSPATIPMALSCVVTRKNFLSQDISYTEKFAQVDLVFDPPWQTPVCVGLASADFPDEDTVSDGHPKLTGDNHEQRPKLRVQLTAPSHPVNGQTVFITLTDSHNPKVARWLNGEAGDTISFLIPPGQTSGEIDGFLGTRKVLSKKTIHLSVRVNGDSSGSMNLYVYK